MKGKEEKMLSASIPNKYEYTKIYKQSITW